ncbi:MAG TPA: DUF4959 domain-containing protein, partial [Sphingobacterium sp.]|nr:DUF4959 domain-containing protein [Sphingobacterium sp.]
MKIKNIQLLTWAVVIALLMSCSQEKYTEPFGSDSAPGLVTDVTVTSLKGGAQIKYKLPADPNLRYVKAVYTVNGQEMEKVASRYDNAIEIHGFPDTREQEIKLYSVSKAGNVSSGFVSAKVSPLTPPVVESFQSLEVNATFGGVLLTFDNPAEANLAVIIRTPDANGNMNIVDTYYTSTVQGIYAIRGFAPEERPFEFVIRDRWGNLSDTLKGSYTPIFEQIISKSGFQALQLQTDTWQPHTALGPQYTMDKIWDGAMGDSPPHPIFHTPPSGTMPKWFTFDMGVVAQ